MLDREGILVERNAEYGIILEKSYSINLVYEAIHNWVDVTNIIKTLNPIWGEEILYFEYKGKSIVALSAKGAPVAANAVERIKRTGGKYILSIGTSGSTDESIKDGQFVLSTAAVRDEGVTSGYLDIRVPALSNPYLTKLFQKELEKLGEVPLHGVTYTTDKRYKENPDELRFLNKAANVLNIDMETSAIILISTYHKIPVAAVNIVTDCAVKSTTGELKGVFDRTKDFKSFVHPKLLLAVEAALNVFTMIGTDNLEHNPTQE